MASDFLDAHERHLTDAELLFQSQRWANADHLYGIAAECGLKRLMCTFGMPVDILTGDPANRHDREHINRIKPRYTAYLSGKELIEYNIDLSAFDDWDVFQRYSNQSDFNESKVSIHRNGASLVRELILKVKLERGIL